MARKRDNNGSLPVLPLLSTDSFDGVTGNETAVLEPAMPASGSHGSPITHLLILCGGVHSVSRNTGSCENLFCRPPRTSLQTIDYGLP